MLLRDRVGAECVAFDFLELQFVGHFVTFVGSLPRAEDYLAKVADAFVFFALQQLQAKGVINLGFLYQLLQEHDKTIFLGLILIFSLQVVLLKFQVKRPHSGNHVEQLHDVLWRKEVLLIVVLERNAVGYLKYSLAQVPPKLRFHQALALEVSQCSHKVLEVLGLLV